MLEAENANLKFTGQARKNSIQKTLRKLARKRDIISSYLDSKNVEVSNPLDFTLVFRAARKHLGATHLRESYHSFSGMHAAYDALIRRIERSALFTQYKPKVVINEDEEIRRFYRSAAWKQVRYKTLQKYGQRCLACGRSVAEGAILHVDHKKPLRKHWKLRLDLENLQPLCSECNHGKGNWDETNYTGT